MKSFFAIEEFLDEKFIPFLEKFVDQEKDNQFYLWMVSKFCSPKAIDLVKKLIQSKGFGSEFLKKSLVKKEYSKNGILLNQKVCPYYSSFIND